MPTRWVALITAVALMSVTAGAASAEIVVTIDKSSQRMTVMRDGQQLYNWPVSTGRPGYSTPSGNYTAFRMEADHFSKEWDDAPMPHSIFFTQIGHAIHGTYDSKHLGSPVSHGCVRLSPENAATLYAMVQQDGVTKTKVFLKGDEKIALARRGTNTVRNEPQQRNQPPGYDAREAARDPWGGRTDYRTADPRYADPRGYPSYPGRQFSGAPRDDYGYQRRYPPQYFESNRNPRRYDDD
jgi:hypothetical protein